jgi:hypothetical protein
VCMQLFDANSQNSGCVPDNRGLALGRLGFRSAGRGAEFTSRWMTEMNVPRQDAGPRRMYP